jgi:hypothetical protein
MRTTARSTRDGRDIREASMSGRLRLFVGLSAGLILAAAVAWIWVPRRESVEQTLALQRRLLTGEVRGRELKAGVTTVVRSVDHMDRDDVKAVRNGLATEWQRILEAGIDEYFAAEESQRGPLLDRHLRRFLTAADLWLATDPRSTGRPPRPRAAKKPPKNAPVPAAVKLFEIYRTAIVARAAKQGVSLPTWLLVPPKK